MLAVTSITFFFAADVKCGLYEINKNNKANATHGLSLVQKMLQDRTEAMLDRRGPGPGPGPVLTLLADVWRAFVRGRESADYHHHHHHHMGLFTRQVPNSPPAVPQHWRKALCQLMEADIWSLNSHITSLVMLKSSKCTCTDSWWQCFTRLTHFNPTNSAVSHTKQIW